MDKQTRMLIAGLVGARPPPDVRLRATHDRRRGTHKKDGGS